MDLAAGARRVWVLMEHCTREGAPRIMKRCTYPLTGMRCVERIYTNYAMMSITPDGVRVERLLPGMTIDELQAMSDAPLSVADACAPYEVPEN
jgi:3-oxoadipate CoA-transferase beta subunit